MAAPTSNVDICNLALDLLNQPPVANVTTPVTTSETICNRWYDSSRRQVLREHVWNFAKTRTVLSRDATDPAFGYSDAYNLPADFLRLLQIGDDYLGDFKLSYEIEGRQLLLSNSGATSLNIVYITDYTNVSFFDSLFTQALAHQLAVNMAYKFTQKNTVTQRLQDELERIIGTAMAVDGQERPPRRIERSKFLSARRRLSKHFSTGTIEID